MWWEVEGHGVEVAGDGREMDGDVVGSGRRWWEMVGDAGRCWKMLGSPLLNVPIQVGLYSLGSMVFVACTLTLTLTLTLTRWASTA